jgi:hypothetical protein
MGNAPKIWLRGLERLWNDMTTTKGRLHIQWKGTRACLDFTCGKCGFNGHIDTDYDGYFLECSGCGQEYQVATMLDMEPVPEPSGRAVRVDNDIPF